MMTPLTIAWEYLTGYAVATDPSSRDRAEWPPHPARVFMALAAAWFETDREAEEGDSLRRLESLGDPEILVPHVDPDCERSNVTYYVPVNDKADAHKPPDKKKKATLHPHLGSVSIGRNRQPRTFPRTWVGHSPCLLHWQNAHGFDSHRAALDRLCRKVTRIGHSSSLVRMWVIAEVARSTQSEGVHYVEDKDELGAEVQARAIHCGMLDMLDECFGDKPRERRATLGARIEELEAAKKAITGKGATKRKAEIDGQVTGLESERSQTFSRPPVRPNIGIWTGYRRMKPPATELASSDFDHDILILSQVAGPTLPLVATLAATRALRATIMKESGVQPTPAWVSGHEPDGSPLRNGNGHMALIPLPHVSHAHADGHLLGVGVVFPRSVDRKDRGQVLGKLLMEEQTKKPTRVVELKLERLGEWKVKKSAWDDEYKHALDPLEWTAFPKGARTWASVTPVVLDKFPKTDRRKPDERLAWEAEVRQIVRKSCTRIGLPEDVLIDVDTTSWHLGSPRAVGKRRPLRGQAASDRDADAALGDGFPSYPAKGSNGPRPQVHVWLRFQEPVIGPVLLGAGRYLGYGLCKPLKEVRQ